MDSSRVEFETCKILAQATIKFDFKKFLPYLNEDFGQNDLLIIILHAFRVLYWF